MSRMTIAGQHLEDMTDDELVAAAEQVRAAREMADDALREGFDEDLAEIAAERAKRGGADV